jgi:ADP-L-glycero-D-manno-heptose 6-epimerase
MIAITGAAGFIGSNLVERLNQDGLTDLLLADDFSREDKKPNWLHRTYTTLNDRDTFLDWLHANHALVEFIFHLGARTDTAERNPAIFNRLNLDYSKALWILCARHKIPIVYASSASVYGSGEFGFDDSDALTGRLQPLNAYGWSKLNFDKWVLERVREGTMPPAWVGLRFFNVYGRHEQHKGRMASVVHHALNQIQESGRIKLFRSHRSDVGDGEQKRDFVHVHDVVKVCMHFFQHRDRSGIYNVGTGSAKSFNELAEALFSAMGRQPQVEFMDTPADIRGNYQYFTQAEVGKLNNSGYKMDFLGLDEGVKLTLESWER